MMSGTKEWNVWTVTVLLAMAGCGSAEPEVLGTDGASGTDGPEGSSAAGSSTGSEPGSTTMGSDEPGGSTGGGAEPPALSCDGPVEFRPEADSALLALDAAIGFFRDEVANHGGYVWRYSEDLQHREGEAIATLDQIWVQPPGTPSVGMAYLRAYEATCNEAYLDAAFETVEALLYGQLRSGGWAKEVDFDPNGSKSADYRNGMGTGKNNSQLDDDTSQSVIVLLSRVDAAMKHSDPRLREAVEYALSRMIDNGQYANGGFGQIWTDDPVEDRPVLEANYYGGPYPPTYPGGDYWWHYTINDSIPGTVTAALVAAYEAYGDAKYYDSLVALGDFLLLAQMPEPQPGWAQQYDADMRPAWARRFEPPAVTGWESQDAMEALIRIAEYTGDDGYLQPFPRAIQYYRDSLLPDGQLARFYELETNTPLYLTRDYELTYDDSDLPTHYGFKFPSRLDDIADEWERVKLGRPQHEPSWMELQPQAQAVIDALDLQGRWVEDGEIHSATFNQNIETLADFIEAARLQ